MQPSRIHHVGLPVSDLNLSVAWYREALGLTHESTSDGVEAIALPEACPIRPSSQNACRRSAPTGAPCRSASSSSFCPLRPTTPESN